ncbi:hypothetical protein VaNZ11_000586 [Volvox africanus]|uniref:Protein Asterix n=1 Tax=Volvox africanus TaxID=51714 RepID=A0ABQ5RNE8_9CHLO|nr:hypothetical protein VaNZ11_000586 [Volvox africanus]
MGADKASVSALSGDPRRPDCVVPYKQRAPSEEKLDAFGTVGMMLALLGMLTRVRIFSFIAIAFVASAFIQRNADTDVKQLFMAGMFSIMGIFFSHLQSYPPSLFGTNTTAQATPAATAGAGAPVHA